MDFHWIDYVIMAIMTVSMITGVFRGFVKEVVSLIIWIAAVWLAYVYATEGAKWLEPHISDPSTRFVLAFILIVLALVILGAIINAIISALIRRSPLSGMDRFLGLLFGILRGVFIAALFLLILNMTSLPKEKYEKESKLFPLLTPIVQWMNTFVPLVLEKVKGLDRTPLREEVSSQAFQRVRYSG